MAVTISIVVPSACGNCGSRDRRLNSCVQAGRDIQEEVEVSDTLTGETDDTLVQDFCAVCN